MRQRNVTGYTLLVQPPDGSHRPPFELAAGEVVDYPTPITGCAADDGVTTPPESTPDPAPAAKTTKTTKASAAPADGGDTK